MTIAELKTALESAKDRSEHPAIVRLPNGQLLAAVHFGDVRGIAVIDVVSAEWPRELVQP